AWAAASRSLNGLEPDLPLRAVFFKAVSWRIISIASSVLTGLISLRLYGLYFEKETYGILLAGWALMSYLPFLDGGFRT
ncbi:hypothetical protein, partial [Salmonella enterica]|uniref:hypothetical protein n=1 Tax=Salmonella enterica TaxID=28901 RepID=UPI00329976E4